MARPARPEPKVFLSDELTARGYDWYLKSFFGHAPEGALLGEKSTSYIEDAKAPQRALRMLGAAEIVVLLRDPVQRAVSNWRFSTDNRREDRSLETALDENFAGSRSWDPEATSVSPFAYLERGRYSAYLEPWFTAFPSNMHVHFLEDLRAGEPALEDLYGSLGVDPGFRPADRGPVNESSEPAPALSAALVERLRDYYAPSDQALSALLGRGLPWPTHAGQGMTHE